MESSDQRLCSGNACELCSLCGISLVAGLCKVVLNTTRMFRSSNSQLSGLTDFEMGDPGGGGGGREQGGRGTPHQHHALLAHHQSQVSSM